MSVRVDLFDRDHGWTRVGAPDAAHLPLRVTTPLGEVSLQLGGVTAEGGLRHCLVCGHPELFTEKVFPTALGFWIVIAAAVLAPWTNYLSLAAAALLDAAFYVFAPDAVVCYVCRSRHRGFAARPRHPRFDHEIAERLKFGPRAVMGKPMREGGTADAPEPEH